jgi:5'-nucleotidase
MKKFEKMVIAVTSRSLFDLETSNKVFKKGIKAYREHQLKHENEPLGKGVAFPLVKKLLKLKKDNRSLVEVVLISRNDPSTGLRAFNAIKKYKLNISRGAFCGGGFRDGYLKAFNVDLFLSAHSDDVKEALGDGIPAATILPRRSKTHEERKIRFAFDGDSVIFSDEAEKINAKKGLKAFYRSEKRQANNPLQPGPFKVFLEKIHKIQNAFPPGNNPIRTALITARSAPAHERAIKTLRKWNIYLNEAFFLGGADKTPILGTYHPDIFFDDQRKNVKRASKKVPSAHVPYGIKNKKKKRK